jgi:hypothetical protein
VNVARLDGLFNQALFLMNARVISAFTRVLSPRRRA